MSGVSRRTDAATAATLEALAMPRASILICYDGSDDAKAAIRHCGTLLSGTSAIVLTVWQPFRIIAARFPGWFGVAPGMPDVEVIDKANADAARKRAAEGAELARDAGFDAEARSRSQSTTVPEAILAEARAVDAAAILMGSRGLTGIRSLLLGSVSHGVLQHADRTVIIEPSPEVAQLRARARRATHDVDRHIERISR